MKGRARAALLLQGYFTNFFRNRHRIERGAFQELRMLENIWPLEGAGLRLKRGYEGSLN